MPTPDRVDILLSERNLDYEGALEIARNDLKFREALLNDLKTTYGVSNVDLDSAIGTMISDTRRARRDVVSEGSFLFEDDLRNYAIGKGGLVDPVMKTEGNQRRISQPVPGTEAHHPASVSSTESLVQNMGAAEVRKLWAIAKKNGYTVGSEAKGFIPLSKPAHTTGGKNWGSDYAHVGADGITPDSGRFKTTALPKGTTAEQAWSSLKPILDEQRKLNDKAFNHPTETMMRQRVEALNGGPVEWQGPVTEQRATQRAALKSKGVNATTISKALDKHQGLKAAGLTPGVDVMTDVGAAVPRSLGKPAVRPPTPKPTAKPKPTSRPVGSHSTLNSKPVVWDGKSWKPVMQNRLRLRSNRRGAAPSNNSVRTSPRAPQSASQQIRRLQNSVPDALFIHPGMSLPSVNLIRGI